MDDHIGPNILTHPPTFLGRKRQETGDCEERLLNVEQELQRDKHPCDLAVPSSGAQAPGKAFSACPPAGLPTPSLALSPRRLTRRERQGLWKIKLSELLSR